jgi:hypothetical protein
MSKIMPLNISYSGDEHDKDIAMAYIMQLIMEPKSSICPLKRISCMG